MLEFFGLLFFICVLLWALPFIISGLVIGLCLVTALVCWLKEKATT